MHPPCPACTTQQRQRAAGVTTALQAGGGDVAAAGLRGAPFQPQQHHGLPPGLRSGLPLRHVKRSSRVLPPASRGTSCSRQAACNSPNWMLQLQAARWAAHGAPQHEQSRADKQCCLSDLRMELNLVLCPLEALPRPSGATLLAGATTTNLRHGFWQHPVGGPTSGVHAASSGSSSL